MVENQQCENGQSNEEVLAAFSEWRSQFAGVTCNGRPLVDEDAVLKTIQRFAEFIEPKGLAESTFTDIDHFVRQLPRVPRLAIMAIEWFRTFRQDLLKPKMVRVYSDGSIE